jgi:hypothetical protein
VTLFDFEQLLVLIPSTNFSNSTLLFSLHTGSSLVFFDLFFFRQIVQKLKRKVEIMTKRIPEVKPD